MAEIHAATRLEALCLELKLSAKVAFHVRVPVFVRASRRRGCAEPPRVNGYRIRVCNQARPVERDSAFRPVGENKSLVRGQRHLLRFRRSAKSQIRFAKSN